MLEAARLIGISSGATYWVVSSLRNFIKFIIKNNPKYLLILILHVSIYKILIFFLLSGFIPKGYILMCVFTWTVGVGAVSVAYIRYTYFNNHVKPRLVTIFIIACLIFIIIKLIFWYFGISEYIVYFLENSVLFINLSGFTLMSGGSGAFERVFEAGASSHRFNTSSPPPGPSGGDPGNTIGTSAVAAEEEENQRVRSDNPWLYGRRSPYPLANPSLIDGTLPRAIYSGTYNTFSCPDSFDPYITNSTRHFGKSFNIDLHNRPVEGLSVQQNGEFRQITYELHESIHRCKMVSKEGHALLTEYNRYFAIVQEMEANNLNETPEHIRAINIRNHTLSRAMELDDLMVNNSDLGDALHTITNTHFENPQLREKFVVMSNLWIRDIKEAMRDRALLEDRDVAG